MFMLNFLIKRICYSFADHICDSKAMSDFKRMFFDFKESFLMLPFHAVTFVCCVKDRIDPPAVYRTNVSLSAAEVCLENRTDETEQAN